MKLLLLNLSNCFLKRIVRAAVLAVMASGAVLPSFAGANVYLVGMPDYEWYYGCFGTAGANVMGFWDRHGFPNFYTGPTGNGLAPLNSFGPNSGIISLWASKAGQDGRPLDKPGHVDDYFVSYLSTSPDPYTLAGRAEHEPDCIGDFIGLDQRKWKNLDNECDGNIDGYSFVYWDHSGNRRVNYTPGPEAGLPAIDIQSGLRNWTTWRNSSATVFTQLASFNPEVSAGKGFTFEDLKAEIDAGYPVLMFLQDVRGKSRDIADMPRANPLIHGIVAYGYFVTDEGMQFVRYRSSFAGGDNIFARWHPDTQWAGIAPLRGLIAYHPLPQITRVSEYAGQLTIEWEGPSSELYDSTSNTTTKVHWYVVEKATSLEQGDFAEITQATTDNKVTISTNDADKNAFFRVKLLPLAEAPE
jgi:hypothetical protein